jgi:hypothetical protein
MAKVIRHGLWRGHRPADDSRVQTDRQRRRPPRLQLATLTSEDHLGRPDRRRSHRFGPGTKGSGPVSLATRRHQKHHW